MSLLQFKPAPMYILDEIDAALDLSHTQHIGQLFKSRFKGSQFIVVSLKEGLFTNANVLFRSVYCVRPTSLILLMCLSSLLGRGSETEQVSSSGRLRGVRATSTPVERIKRMRGPAVGEGMLS